MRHGACHGLSGQRPRSPLHSGDAYLPAGPHISSHSQPRHFVYNVSSGVGIGHALASISIYAEYARRTGRQFHVLCDRWNLGLDHTAEIDPLFAAYFELASFEENAIGLSKLAARGAILETHKAGRSFLLVGQGMRGITENFHRFEFLHALDMVSLDGFRPYLREYLDHSADCIIMETVTPYSAQRKDFSFFAGFSPAARLGGRRQFPELENLALDRRVGLHIRHGNGEILQDRPTGNSDEFENLLKGICHAARQLADEQGLEIIAFSDNTRVLERLQAEYGIDYLPGGPPPDITWQALTRGEDTASRMRALEAMMRDFNALTRCRFVVCGSSLFTVAAYLFSRYRQFVRVAV